MKISRLVLVIIILIPLAAFAGKIYGTIKDGKRPVKKGTQVTITTLPDNTGEVSELYSASTDTKGVYSCL